jgi:hypothetical protein
MDPRHTTLRSQMWGARPLCFYRAPPIGDATAAPPPVATPDENTSQAPPILTAKSRPQRTPSVCVTTFPRCAARPDYFGTPLTRVRRARAPPPPDGHGHQRKALLRRSQCEPAPHAASVGKGETESPPLRPPSTGSSRLPPTRHSIVASCLGTDLKRPRSSACHSRDPSLSSPVVMAGYKPAVEPSPVSFCIVYLIVLSQCKTNLRIRAAKDV